METCDQNSKYDYEHVFDQVITRLRLVLRDKELQVHHVENISYILGAIELSVNMDNVDSANKKGKEDFVKNMVGSTMSMVFEAIKSFNEAKNDHHHRPVDPPPDA